MRSAHEAGRIVSRRCSAIGASPVHVAAEVLSIGGDTSGRR